MASAGVHKSSAINCVPHNACHGQLKAERSPLLSGDNQTARKYPWGRSNCLQGNIFAKYILFPIFTKARFLFTFFRPSSILPSSHLPPSFLRHSSLILPKIRLNLNVKIYFSIHLKLKLNAIICDAPAKSLMKQTKGHSGYTCLFIIKFNSKMCSAVSTHSLIF